MVDSIAKTTIDSMVRDRQALIGSPDDVIEQLRYHVEFFGEFEASLQVNFGGASEAEAARTLELIARHVMPSVQPAAGKPARVNARTRRSVRRHVLIYAGLIPFLVIALFPLYWMAITAFKRDSDLYAMSGTPFWFNEPPTLVHFVLLIKKTYFVPQLVNSLLLAVCVVTITVVVAVPAGYALARLRLPGAENLGIGIFMTYLVPPIILFIPLARVVGGLGLFDSWWALVVVYPSFTIPFCTWKMFAYFKAVPREIEEAAWVDGCGLRLCADPGRGASQPPGSAHHRDLLVLAGDAGVPVRGRVRGAPSGEGGHGRSDDVLDPWRHLLLGLADGRRPDHRHPGRAALCPRPRSVHPGTHRGSATRRAHPLRWRLAAGPFSSR